MQRGVGVIHLESKVTGMKCHPLTEADKRPLNPLPLGPFPGFLSLEMVYPSAFVVKKVLGFRKILLVTSGMTSLLPNACCHESGITINYKSKAYD